MSKCLGWCDGKGKPGPGRRFCPRCQTEKAERERGFGFTILNTFDRPRIHGGRVLHKTEGGDS
jgi:hypothetical protein